MDSSAIPPTPPTNPSPNPTANDSWKSNPSFLEKFQNPEIREQNRLKATEANSQFVKPPTAKMRRFVKEYLSDPTRNKAQAALRAGYSDYAPSESARQVLQHPWVKAEIERADRELFERLEITPERVTLELAAIAFARMPDYLTEEKDKDGTYPIDLSRIDAVQAAAIKSVKVEKYGGTVKQTLELHDKLAALQALGRITGVQLDSKTPTQQNNIQLNVNFLDEIVERAQTQIEGK